MHEIPTATLHFDPPYPGLVGGAILHGWLVPKAGHHYTDLRVRAGGEIFPGVYGLPRRDLAEFFKSDQSHLLAGFSITLTLPTGRHHLVLEGCSLAGTWVELDALERDVSATEALPDPVARAPLDAAAVGECLWVLLHRLATGNVTPNIAARVVIEETSPRHHLQHPPRPFHGHLDQPQIWSRSVFGRLSITGWVFHESLPIKRVFATTDLQAAQNLPYGRATPFLAGRPGATALASHAGYDGFLDLPAQLPHPVSVRVYAELEDGSWHLGSVARFTATDQEFAKQAFTPFSPLAFWRAWRALLDAIRGRGWAVPTGSAYRQTIRAVWRDYAALAPRRASPRQPTGIANHVPADGGLIHLITHNLSHEGAPLFLLEYARHLHLEGWRLAVTSGREGMLRRDFEALGATVAVVDPTPVLAPRNARDMRSALADLGRQVDLRGARLAVINTLQAYWGVHLAHAAGRAALFYIHESSPPRAFFRDQMPAGALPVVEESFRLARRVSFLTATTRHYYDDLSDGSNYCLNPGWIDLATIDAFRAAHPRELLRTRLGLSPERRLVINVGTLCERKGQHLFARAVDLLWRTAPALAASADFLMIGGRDTPYDRALANFLAGVGRPNLWIVPETGEVYPYYGAADLFVCSSYEESFPRVVLEAMAFELPMICSGVHGIPEIARADRETLLVPPGDSAALAAALQHLLSSLETGRTLAQRARKRVAGEFDSRVLLPRHAALLPTLTSR